MKMKFFWVGAIPGSGVGESEEELNQFLGSHRVARIDREFTTVPSPGWAICVEYVEGKAGAGGKATSSSGKSSSVDYREVLDEETFRLYSVIRAWRKKAAGVHGVPVYAVASNEQLAQIAKMRIQRLSQLESVEGFGKARMEKYGRELLECFMAAMAEAAPAAKPPKSS
ncbi:MAG: HRDC domain-containing protein [Verrucomicrobiota bacterium]